MPKNDLFRHFFGRFSGFQCPRAAPKLKNGQMLICILTFDFKL